MKIPKWIIRPRYDKPILYFLSDGISTEIRFKNDTDRDGVLYIFNTLFQENERLQKELKYKNELLQTVLEDLDDACNEVLELQEVTI